MWKIVTIIKLSTLLLIVALLTLVVAYALWAETLTINGTVTTAELDVNFSEYDCYDTENLATISATLASDPDILLVTVDKGYPGYVGHCWAEYTVAGDLPVRIKAITFTPGSDLTGCVNSAYNPNTGSFTATCDQLEVKWSNGLCTYFDVGESESSNLRVTVRDGAAMLTPYHFTVAYTFEQANTSSCP